MKFVYWLMISLLAKAAAQVVDPNYIEGEPNVTTSGMPGGKRQPP